MKETNGVDLLVCGVALTVAAFLGIKAAYEYGRYSAVHDIHKKGWTVVDNTEHNEDKEETLQY